ncbi:MAG: hypothetical protein WCH39_06650 [Schlesneria sp.]
MTTTARKVRTRTRRKTYSLLMVSLLVHAFVLLVMLQFSGSRSAGRGTGDTGNGDNWSATWIPGSPGGAGESKGKGVAIDTVIPDAESDRLNDVHQTIEIQPANEKPRLLTVVETDPQTVFSATKENSNAIESELHASLKTADRNKLFDVQSARFNQPDLHDSAVKDRDSASIEGESTSDQTEDGLPSNRDNTDGKGAGGEPGKGGTPGSGGHQTSFFGIKAPAKRIVYVIDASESMRQHDAMQFARQKLWDSLQDLTPTSQFQVIFFNVTNHAMNRPGERTRLLPATSINLRLARQFLTGIQPDSGTNRMGALSLAFSYDPDVIYLLTDADAPELSAKDLWDLKRGNKRKAFVHVVEFGVGADLSSDNFLKKLARQNAGIHRYHDLTQAQR